MKNITTQIVSLMLIVAFAQGCAKPKANVASSPVCPGPQCQTQDPGGAGLPGGMSSVNGATFTPTSYSVFSSYAARSVPSTTPIFLKLNMGDVGSGRFAGTMSLTYTVNGQTISSDQKTWDPRQSAGNASDADYNYQVSSDWSNASSRKFQAFFQDNWGGLVVIITGRKQVKMGDGQVFTTYNGEIWFKDFKQGYNYNPNQGNLPCWKISVGPYDCRTFLTYSGKPNDGTNTPLHEYQQSRVHSVNPASSAAQFPTSYNGNTRADYAKLGTFTDLSATEAFGQALN